jgi:hypothetical protein
MSASWKMKKAVRFMPAAFCNKNKKTVGPSGDAHGLDYYMIYREWAHLLGRAAPPPMVS